MACSRVGPGIIYIHAASGQASPEKEMVSERFIKVECDIAQFCHSIAYSNVFILYSQKPPQTKNVAE